MPNGPVVPDDPIVALQAVSRRFGDVPAVDEITLDLQRGTVLGVIGPSGSGKTTLIRMLTGTLAPTGGKLVVLGQNPLKFSRHAREKIGYMPQHFVLYPELTASENLNFVAALFGLLWPRRGRRVRQVLQLVELWDARNRRAQHLSGGMQRRLELACALVHDPVLLFVDEPTAGLDPLLRQSIWAEFRRLRELGRTLVVTTQYVAEAEYCDLVAVLSEGRLVALAEPDHLRRVALGGEIIEVRTAEPFDGVRLEDLSGVRSIAQQSPRHLFVTADDAGTITPRVTQAIQSAGVEVTSIAEYHPSFDEVFAALIKNAETAHQEQAGARDRRDVPRAA